MSWVTVIWSMIASACLTLAAIYSLVWSRNRTAWAHLLFAATAASTAAFTFCELRQMRAGTPGELLAAMRWTHVSLLCLLVSTVVVRHALPRRGTALAGLDRVRPARALPAGSLSWSGGTSTTARSRVCSACRFSGTPSRYSKASPNPWMLFGYVTMLLILVFVADASVTAWRRGERRKALMVGGQCRVLSPARDRSGRADPLGPPAHPRSHQPALPGPGRRDGVRVEPRRAAGVATRPRASGQRSRAARERGAHEPGRRCRRVRHLDPRPRARRSLGERKVAGRCLASRRPSALEFDAHPATAAPGRSRTAPAGSCRWRSRAPTAADTRRNTG